ncbi:D-isomer specific 2-hydroxyacid dehydrogenase family protein [Vibrio neptunius]|uniref:D-isomer specific 2-hydroxyacid dehydrogenase family protein n=1 Tax=Vibrio neptunius TaxID=170651 RepID=UPI003314BE21
MKIVNLDPWNYSEEAKKIYNTLGEYSEYSNLSREELKRVILDTEILILRLSHRLDKEILSCSNHLKYIVTNCTGLDHIDLDYCNENGIKVISLKGEIDFLRGIYATAELTWGLIIDSHRNISAAQNHVVDTLTWNRDLFFGQDLYGKSIGILGFGRIGEKICRYARAFGMNVFAYDPSPISEPEGVVFLDSIEQLFNENIDIISIHINYSSENHHLISRALISKLDSATIINTSRGAVVKEDDIIEGLELKNVKCYATDVLENENSSGFLKDSALLRAKNNGKNIIITPHIGGVTYESWHKTEDYCARKLMSSLDSNEKA